MEYTEKPKQKVEVNFAKYESIRYKNTVSIPTHERFKFKNRRGYGLFKKDDALDYLRKQTKVINFWIWTPIKLTNNTLSSHSELTCRACNAKTYYLRIIKDHLKTNKNK